jgi:glycosyltransferase involved in cell wall biosynthesis
VDDARIKVVYLGADAADFRPRTSEERAKIRASFGWKDSRLKVAFVGAFADERKGFATLYAAWKRLCASPSWDGDLVVVGVGRHLESWRERARTDGIGHRVEFLGFRTDVPVVVGACDLLVAPSRYEPYGLAVHEALCSGVAAITSAISGVAEMYPESLRHWLLPDPADDVDLARRIERWRPSAGTPPPELRALSDRLRARDWEVVARELVAACEGENG